jgi:hypothetical protein
LSDQTVDQGVYIYIQFLKLSLARKRGG